MGALPKKAWKGKRINWDRELKEGVYAAVAPYWGTYTIEAAWKQAQEDVGVPHELRRKYSAGTGVELAKLYGPAGRGAKVRTFTPRANGRHVGEVPPTPIAVAGTTDDAPTLETPTETDSTPSAPIPAVGAASAPGSLEQAIGVVVQAFGGLIREAFTDAIAKALTSPHVAAAFAEVIRPLAQQSAIVPDEHDDAPAGVPVDIETAIQLSQEHRKEREELPRVLVAGLLPNQIKKVQEHFAGRVNLRFWKSSDSGAMLRKQIPGIDAAVGMVGFMGHSADHTLSARAPTYLRASGGVTSVKHQIEKALKMLELERNGHVAR